MVKSDYYQREPTFGFGERGKMVTFISTEGREL